MLTRPHPSQSVLIKQAVNTERDRVLAQARHILSSHSRPFAAAIHCDFFDGVLTVTGQVPSFYLKQLVQAALQDIEGLRCVDNQVDVVNPVGRSSVRGT